MALAKRCDHLIDDTAHLLGVENRRQLRGQRNRRTIRDGSVVYFFLLRLTLTLLFFATLTLFFFATLFTCTRATFLRLRLRLELVVVRVDLQLNLDLSMFLQFPRDFAHDATVQTM